MTIATLLGLYLKFNLLLALALLLWLGVKKAAALAHFSLSHARCLQIARGVFSLQLVLVPLATLLTLFAPALLMSSEQAVLNVYTVMSMDVLQQKPHEDWPLTLAGMLAVSFVLGLFTALVLLSSKILHLRDLINEASRWKQVGKVVLLFSADIRSPFSTFALGRRHIVMPWLLLEKPAHLRMAVQHELQHFRNGDLHWVLLLEVLRLLCFWNPAIYRWKHEFDNLQELACDEALVRSRNVDARAYGNCLLDVAVHVGSDEAMWASSSMVPHFSEMFDPNAQLKQRIAMLVDMRSGKHAALKASAFGLLVGIGMFYLLAPLFAADPSMADITPLTRINPEYPAQALAANMEAEVQIAFDLDNKGNVINPRVVRSCEWQQGADRTRCSKSPQFEKAALTAFSQWKYSVPRTKAWVSIPVEDMRTILRFSLQ
jgi:TonB family protein